MSDLFWVATSRRGIDHHLVRGQRTVCGRGTKSGALITADVAADLKSNLCAECAGIVATVNAVKAALDAHPEVTR